MGGEAGRGGSPGVGRPARLGGMALLCATPARRLIRLPVLWCHRVRARDGRPKPWNSTPRGGDRVFFRRDNRDVIVIAFAVSSHLLLPYIAAITVRISRHLLIVMRRTTSRRQIQNEKWQQMQ